MAKRNSPRLIKLLSEVRACALCEGHLPLGPRPTLAADSRARLLIIGQAPGTKVHETGIPWNDPSGDRLREWMGIDKDVFYDASRIAIMPMGFCYPGRGKSGDLPPRPECAPAWHGALLELLPNVELVLLVGSYAQAYYLDKRYKTLRDRVKNWQEYGPRFIPLVHPSPRNRKWLRDNPWFEAELVPQMRKRVHQVLDLA